MTPTQTILAFATGFALLAQGVHADGLQPTFSDPVVTAPAETWSGPYIGLSYGRVSSSTETVECFKLSQPKACDDPIFIAYPEYKVEVRSETETSDSAAGILVGYRFDMGRIVPGVELGIYDGAVVPGAQIGLDLGGVLPYAHYDRDGAAFGIEAKLSSHLSAGVRAGKDRAALTVSWGF